MTDRPRHGPPLRGGHSPCRSRLCERCLNPAVADNRSSDSPGHLAWEASRRETGDENVVLDRVCDVRGKRTSRSLPAGGLCLYQQGKRGKHGSPRAGVRGVRAAYSHAEGSRTPLSEAFSDRGELLNDAYCRTETYESLRWLIRPSSSRFRWRLMKYFCPTVAGGSSANNYA